MSRDMLSRRLRRSGFEVLLASDGKTAVEKAAQEVPDLIILDLSLPVLDGWEAAVRIKNAAATAHIPIMALTAHALDGERARALAAGCDDYETKPFDFKVLMKKISRLMEAS